MTDMDKRLRLARLLDAYGALLTERQRAVCRAYYEDDLSLAETSEQEGVSRQAVHEALRAAEEALERFETALGLVARVEALEEVESAPIASTDFSDASDSLDVATDLRALAAQLRAAGGAPDPATLADRLDALADRLDETPG